jgi:hypothetical protein
MYYKAHTGLSMEFLDTIAETFSKPSSATLTYPQVVKQVHSFASLLVLLASISILREN